MALLNSYRPRLGVIGAVSLVCTVAACTERIEGGAACPVLCPLESEAVRDTVLAAVALDTTIAGYPYPGEQSRLLLALRPGADSVDVRSVVRFDSLPKRYFPAGGADSADIVRVDSSFLELHVDTLSVRGVGALRIEAYDVDTAAAVDTATAALSALFRPDRLLGSASLDSGRIRGDTLRIRLANAAVAAKASGGRPLRVGLRLVGTSPGQMRIYSAAGASTLGARLSFDPATDTVYAPIVLGPSSATPAGNAEIAAGLRDFAFAAVGTRAPAGTDLIVGGVPGRRAYLRFAIPARIADSTTLVRATLTLVQVPVRGVDPADSVALVPDVVVANESITDLRRVLALVSTGAALGIDSLRLAPADSGRRVLSLINLVRSWRALAPGTQRAIVLRASLEGAQAAHLRFLSSEAAPALRPQLRISYIPRSNFGLP